MSQAEAAARAKLDCSYFGRIERGTANPSISVLINVARALGVELHRFFDGDSPPRLPELKVERVDLPNLSKEGISKIEKILELPAGHSVVTQLKIVADAYLQRNAALLGGTIRAQQRRRIKALSEALVALERALEPIQGTDLLQLIHAGVPPMQHIEALNHAARTLGPACASIAERELSRASEARHHLFDSVGWLAQIYEEATHRKPTHSTALARNEDLRPSPFDQMVIAFFKMVDPNLKQDQLNQPLAQLWPSRQKPHSRRI